MTPKPGDVFSGRGGQLERGDRLAEPIRQAHRKQKKNKKKKRKKKKKEQPVQ